jgi:ADP-ribose pyrophosphatase YjhB (NUDIX family)
MIWKPHVTVAAIVERDGKFLLIEEQAEGKVVLNQPAGHLDPGERLIDAVVRETLEETAWHFRPEALLGVYRWQKPDSDITYLRFAFIGQLLGHDPARALDHGILRAVWLTAEEVARAADRLRSPQVLRCINDYRSGKRYSLDALRDLG